MSLPQAHAAAGLLFLRTPASRERRKLETAPSEQRRPDASRSSAIEEFYHSQPTPKVAAPSGLLAEDTGMVGIARGELDRGRGQRLEEALRIRNIKKMYVLAIEMGVNESAISRWRKGAPIATDNVIKLCETLDISADWLLLAKGGIDQHIAFSVSREERELLNLLRPFPRDFLRHFNRAIEAIAPD